MILANDHERSPERFGTGFGLSTSPAVSFPLAVMKDYVSIDEIRIKKTQNGAPKNRVSLLFGEHSRELIGPETGLMLLTLGIGQDLDVIFIVSHKHSSPAAVNFVLHPRRLFAFQENAVRRDRRKVIRRSAERFRVSADPQCQSGFSSSCGSRRWSRPCHPPSVVFFSFHRS